MVSQLALCAWDAALLVRETEFGETLRRARAGTDINELRGLELSFDPALQRTVAAVISMRGIGHPIPDQSRLWVEWAMKGVQAVQRIAAKCWAVVPREVRKGFVDFDDALPPAMAGEFSDLRKDEPGRLALRFAGLDAQDVRESLSALYAEIKRTETAGRARDAGVTLSDDSRLMSKLLGIRNRVEAEARKIYAGETGIEAFGRSRRVISEAYDDAEDLTDIVRSLRVYNRLITQVIWTLLGLAEQVVPARLSEHKGAIIDGVVDSERHISLTVTEAFAAFLRPTHPVWIEFGSPLDGLYFVERHTMAWSGSEEDDLGLIAFDWV